MSVQTQNQIGKCTCIVCKSACECPEIPSQILPGTAQPAARDSVRWGLCPDHAQLYEAGLVSMIEVDFGSRDLLADDFRFPRLEDLARTGRVVHLPHEALVELLHLGLKRLPPAIFIPTGIFDRITGEVARLH